LFFNVLLAITFISFVFMYLWFLTWPKVQGEIKERFIWESGSQFKWKFKLTYIDYEHQGEKKTCTRQSVIVKNGFGTKRPLGSSIKVSVCPLMPSMSVPFRPYIELLILIFMTLVLVGCYWLFQWLSV